MERNIIIARFTGSNSTKTRRMYQYDYGQILKFDLSNLPFAYEVHFSNAEQGGESITAIGNSNGVLIPDSLFTSGEDIWCWLFLHEDANDGETVYKVQIPVMMRPQPDNTEPTPEQQSAIDEAIIALNEGVEAAEGYANDAHQSADDADDSRKNAEAWAVGTKDGVPVSEEEEQYNNNAKSYATNASNSARTASEKAEEAKQAKQSIENMTVTAVTLPTGAEAYVEKTQEEGEPCNLEFGLPRGEKGEKGNVMFAAFYVDEEGDLCEVHDEEYTGPAFEIDEEGDLEVLIYE